MTNCNAVNTPVELSGTCGTRAQESPAPSAGAGDAVAQILSEEVTLTRPEDAKKYRRVASRINYLDQGRIDISVAANYLARNMTKPKLDEHRRIEKLTRYLIGRLLPGL